MEHTFNVRDKRCSRRYFIDNILLRGGWGKALGPPGIAVYNALALHADSEGQSAFPRLDLIGELTGMSRPTVIKYIEMLEGFNIIAVDRSGRNNTYFLIDRDEWRPVNEVYKSESVNEVYTTCKAGLHDDVKEVYTNNTHETIPNNKTHDVGADAPVEEKPLTPAQAVFGALVDVCRFDLKLITQAQRGQLNQTGKKLRERGITADDIRAFGEWWFKEDWRGKKGQSPKPHQVRETWGQFAHYKNGSASGNGAGRKTMTDEQRARFRELRAQREREKAAEAAEGS